MSDWCGLLHRLREREVEWIFRLCPAECFPQALELGAGDGYQSGLLQRYCRELVATDWNIRLLRKIESADCRVVECDAEKVGDRFPPGTFDLVFSSNVLEHLPRPSAALRGIHDVLSAEGITVHVMPSPLWKCSDFTLYYADLCWQVLRRMRRRADVPHAVATIENNPKLAGTASRSRLWPRPHGAYRSHLQELFAYRRARWLREFRDAGFDVIRIMKGPVSSGWGLGWERARAAAERLGIATEHVYVAVKRDRRSRYTAFFVGDV